MTDSSFVKMPAMVYALRSVADQASDSPALATSFIPLTFTIIISTSIIISSIIITVLSY